MYEQCEYKMQIINKKRTGIFFYKGTHAPHTNTQTKLIAIGTIKHKMK